MKAVVTNTYYGAYYVPDRLYSKSFTHAGSFVPQSNPNRKCYHELYFTYRKTEAQALRDLPAHITQASK